MDGGGISSALCRYGCGGMKECYYAEMFLRAPALYKTTSTKALLFESVVTEYKKASLTVHMFLNGDSVAI